MQARPYRVRVIQKAESDPAVCAFADCIERRSGAVDAGKWSRRVLHK